jgi:hypothetical protein
VPRPTLNPRAAIEVSLVSIVSATIVTPEETPDAASAVAVAGITRSSADMEREAGIYEEHVTDQERVLAEEGPPLVDEPEHSDIIDDLDEFEPLESFDPDADPGEAIAAAHDSAWHASPTTADCTHAQARLVETRGFTDTDTVRLCYYCPDCNASFEREVLPNDPEILPPWT